MSDKELTIENLGVEIKHLVKIEVLEKYKGKQCVYGLKNCGFGLRILITLVEEENPIRYVIDRKPVYRRPKIIAVSNGFTNDDFDFFQKERIFPPHEPPIAIKQPEEDYLLSQIKSIIMGVLDSETGCYHQLLLLKYGIGMRVNLSVIQEDSPQLIVKEKSIKLRTRKQNIDFTDDDQSFLQKNRLIGF